MDLQLLASQLDQLDHHLHRSSLLVLLALCFLQRRHTHLKLLLVQSRVSLPKDLFNLSLRIVPMGLTLLKLRSNLMHLVKDKLQATPRLQLSLKYLLKVWLLTSHILLLAYTDQFSPKDQMHPQAQADLPSHTRRKGLLPMLSM